MPQTLRSKSADPTSDNRRTHTKSRNGCLVCKRRRVKCDETRPRCRRCTYGNRPCSYRRENEAPGTLGSSAASTVSAPTASASASSGWDITGSVALTGSAGEFCATGTFDLIHMRLLHHAHTHLDDLMGVSGDTGPLLDVVMDKASQEPYVLDQLLALSALHLKEHQSVPAMYARQAEELQTRALGAFNQVRGGVSDANYLAVFLFATMLGVHLLHDSLASLDGDLSTFVRKFVEYMRLHRGIRAVTNSHWQQIVGSQLQPLLYITSLSDSMKKLQSGEETGRLSEFLTSKCNASSSSIAACLEALRCIQWMLDLIRFEPTRREIAIQAIIAWPLVVSEDYIEAMYQHRPEAFAVFAYWAATLHRLQDFWVFGKDGANLVRMITQHIGPFWQDGLLWPLGEVCSSEYASVTHTPAARSDQGASS